jgi:molybdopterin/thiamine biosynthesis adenylyltransferase
MSSAAPIVLSADLEQLATEFEVEVRVGIGAFLLVHGVPFVDSNKSIRRGTLVTPLSVELGKVVPGGGQHQAWLVGGLPCDINGTPLVNILSSKERQALAEDLWVDCGFSTKERADLPYGYTDYRAKMIRYINILSAPARALDKTLQIVARPITWKVEDSPFIYTDTASSRSGYSAVAAKLRKQRIAIVGLGGTGSYALDLLARCPVQEIHLFDGDILKQHNIFRSPGMVNYFDLLEPVLKVDYYAGRYGQLRRGVVPHAVYVTDENVTELGSFDFVFVAVDKVAARKIICEYLLAQGIPFIDCGMHVDMGADQSSLYGQVRTTLCTPSKSDHFAKKVPVGGDDGDDIYASNIQIAELNCLNAVMAVYRWKVHLGFYSSRPEKLHSLVFVTDSGFLAQGDYA